MMFTRFIKKFTISAGAVLMALTASFSQLGTLTSSAADQTFSPLVSHEGEQGYYLYHFEGKLTNPCHSDAIKEKSNVIGSLWFDFTYIDDNGTGTKHTERLDMSYSKGKNLNNDFLKKNFVRNNDNETGLAFDLYIPGQLTNVRFHLELNGQVSFFSYERMSFEIKNVTANGIKVNSGSDYVSSAVGSSDGSINFIMDKPDNIQIASAFGQKEVTLNQFKAMIDSGELATKELKDKYGALFTDEALRKIAEASDSEINQGFSHSDEPGMYNYTLNMKIDNPVNVSSSGPEKIETFIIDFTCENGKKYRLDMSWDFELSRNRNSTFANLFCRPDDDETSASMNVWLPGRVTSVDAELNMSAGERFTVTFVDVLLCGLKVNTESDYVSSAVMTSKAHIECNVPESLTDLSGLGEEDLINVLEAIYAYDGSGTIPAVRDQFGSIVGADAISAAHDDMITCINAVKNDRRPIYDDVIPGCYMYMTVYRAESIDGLQTFIEEKREEVRQLDKGAN